MTHQEQFATAASATLTRLSALVAPGEIKVFDPFSKDFCLTDVVLDLLSSPEGLSSKASCSLWLMTPSEGKNEILFQCHIDVHGHQVHLNTGIFCVAGSYLTANSGVATEGSTGTFRVMLTGYNCS